MEDSNNYVLWTYSSLDYLAEKREGKMNILCFLHNYNVQFSLYFTQNNVTNDIANICRIWD